MRHFFIPPLYMRGKAFKARWRFVRWRGVRKCFERFDRGSVLRLWLGWVLFVVMIEDT